MPDVSPTIDDMNTRSREVFRRVVEGYLETWCACWVAHADARFFRESQRGDHPQRDAGP